MDLVLATPNNYAEVIQQLQAYDPKMPVVVAHYGKENDKSFSTWRDILSYPGVKDVMLIELSSSPQQLLANIIAKLKNFSNIL